MAADGTNWNSTVISLAVSSPTSTALADLGWPEGLGCAGLSTAAAKVAAVVQLAPRSLVAHCHRRRRQHCFAIGAIAIPAVCAILISCQRLYHWARVAAMPPEAATDILGSIGGAGSLVDRPLLSNSAIVECCAGRLASGDGAPVHPGTVLPHAALEARLAILGAAAEQLAWWECRAEALVDVRRCRSASERRLTPCQPAAACCRLRSKSPEACADDHVLCDARYGGCMVGPPGRPLHRPVDLWPCQPQTLASRQGSGSTDARQQVRKQSMERGSTPGAGEGGWSEGWQGGEAQFHSDGFSGKRFGLRTSLWK
eukprot:SM001421S00568  [mRNA]  locus=s1421:73:1011:- [translate_table: standard]